MKTIRKNLRVRAGKVAAARKTVEAVAQQRGVEIFLAAVLAAVLAGCVWCYWVYGRGATSAMARGSSEATVTTETVVAAGEIQDSH